MNNELQNNGHRQWWKNDKDFPVPNKTCRKCTYRGYGDSMCSYILITGRSKPAEATLKEAPYCLCFKKGKKQRVSTINPAKKRSGF